MSNRTPYIPVKERPARLQPPFPLPGEPWGWRISPGNKQINLVSYERGKGQPTVLSFSRWGMQGAEFYLPGKEGDGMFKVSELMEPIPGQEHNFDIYAQVNHPVMETIARAPEYKRRAETAEERIEAAVAKLNAGLNPDGTLKFEDGHELRAAISLLTGVQWQIHSQEEDNGN